MRTEPVLILISGDTRRVEHTVGVPPLAFATQAQGLSFTSCSGLFITADDARNDTFGLVLFPAAALRPWLHQNDHCLDSPTDTSPPSLIPECAICAVGSITALNGAALLCSPFATLRIHAAAQAAAQLLRSLNRDSGLSSPSSTPWAFQWSIGGPSCTAAEQGALVLCWARLLPNGATYPPVASPTQPPDPLPTATSSALQAPSHNNNHTVPNTAQSPKPAGALPSPVLLAPSPHPPDGPLEPRSLRTLQALYDDVTSTCPCPHNSGGLIMPYSSTAVPFPPPPPATVAGAGSLVAVLGSPFGCLAPFHFLNSQVNGAIASVFPAPLPAAAAAIQPRMPPPANYLSFTGAGGMYDIDGREGAPTGAPTNKAHQPAPPAALYALDAHVFPGMEGAPIVPLRLPLASLTGALMTGPLASASQALGGLGSPAGAGGGETSTSIRVLATTATAVSSNSDGSTGDCDILHVKPRAANASAPPPPLGVLLTPLCRRVDGVQIPLAMAWDPLAAALRELLAGVLIRDLGVRSPGGGSMGAAAVGVAAGEGPGGELGLAPARGYEPQPPHMAICAAGRVEGGVGSERWDMSPQPCGTTACCHPDNPTGPDPTHLPPASLPAWVLHSVVLLRCNGSWATGVLVEPRSGLLITTAHLLRGNDVRQSGGGQHSGQAGADRPLPGDGAMGAMCWARVPWVASSGGGNGGGGGGSSALPCRWLRARVLYVWNNHLDLAVLQLEPPYGGRWVSAMSSPLALAAVQEAARARVEEGEEAVGVTACGSGSEGQRQRHHPEVPVAVGCDVEGGAEVVGGQAQAPPPTLPPVDGPAQGLNGVYGRGHTHGTYGPGTPVWAVGHSLVGPSAEWPALVSHGCVTRVLRRRCGRPTMVLATCTTHAGGSGGALLDAAGRLVGLITSNARHTGGRTLTNMAFCIAAEELEPVLAWAKAAAAASAAEGGSGGATPLSSLASPSFVQMMPPLPSVSSLAAMDVPDDDTARIWRLQMPSLKQHTRGAAGGSDMAGGVATLGAAAAAGSNTDDRPRQMQEDAGGGAGAPRSRL